MHNRWHLYDELVDSVPSKELVKSFVYGDHWLMVESGSTLTLLKPLFWEPIM